MSHQRNWLANTGTYSTILLQQWCKGCGQTLKEFLKVIIFSFDLKFFHPKSWILYFRYRRGFLLITNKLVQVKQEKKLVVLSLPFLHLLQRKLFLSCSFHAILIYQTTMPWKRQGVKVSLAWDKSYCRLKVLSGGDAWKVISFPLGDEGC